MPGLTFSNELISRDEGLHTDFGCHMYNMLNGKLPLERLHTIIKEAVEIEKVGRQQMLQPGCLGLIWRKTWLRLKCASCYQYR